MCVPDEGQYLEGPHREEGKLGRETKLFRWEKFVGCPTPQAVGSIIRGSYSRPGVWV